MFHKLFPTLRKKVALAVSLVMVLGGGIFLYVAHRTGFSMFEQQQQLKAKNIADIYTGVVEHIMLEGKPQLIKQAFRNAVLAPDVRDLFILREDGTVFFSASDTSINKLPLSQFQPIAGNRTTKFFSLYENNSLVEYILTPIPKKKECYSCHQHDESLRGYFAVKIIMDDVYFLARQHRTLNILISVLTFLGVGGILYFSLAALVINPVQKLNTSIRGIENSLELLKHGEQISLPLLPAISKSGEIADMSRDFNSLITQLNNANAKLYNTHQMQLEHVDRLAATGEMAASIAHEIKNPVTGILGALQVFEKEMTDENPRKEILVEMMAQLDRVNHAVNDLLTYAKPTPPAFTKISSSELIHRTLSLLQKQIQEKNITINIELSPVHDIIYADRKQLQQVFWNIIINGIQAMESGGTLTISSVHENSSVKFIIVDTGKGIPIDEIEKVFKPFYTTKHKGTGLGMTISQRIIQHHNGKITITSLLGKGTLICITLPQQHEINS
jgi:signal transduction histidine kinase